MDECGEETPQYKVLVPLVPAMPWNTHVTTELNPLTAIFSCNFEYVLGTGSNAMILCACFTLAAKIENAPMFAPRSRTKCGVSGT
jgi:hypothetical protein